MVHNIPISHSPVYYATHLRKKQEKLFEILEFCDDDVEYISLLKEESKKFDYLISGLFGEVNLNEAFYQINIISLDDNTLRVRGDFEPTSLESVIELGRTYLNVYNGVEEVSHSITIDLKLACVSDDSYYSLPIPSSIVSNYIRILNSKRLMP